jgi:uncharacterized protein (DUF2147 family)
MKKSLLVSSIAFLATIGLVGCGGSGTASSVVCSSCTTCPTTTTSSSTPVADPNANPTDGNPAVTLPEGKKCAYLVKLTLPKDLPSYDSIFLTGCMNQVKDSSGKLTGTWAFGLDAIEMQPITGNAGWYVGYDDEVYNAATYKANLGTGVSDQANEYSLVAGYNSSAEIADSKKGLQWVDTYKADYVASFAYPTNATFESATGDNVRIILHEDNFAKLPSEPEAPLNYYTIKVAFQETVNGVTSPKALPEWEIPHLFGSFNGWATSYSAENEVAARMTPNADRTIWSYTFASIIPDTYEITMSLDWTVESLHELDRDASGFNWKKPDNWAAANLKLTIHESDGGFFTMTDEDALTADMTKLGTFVAPDQVANVKFVIKNTGTALAATQKVFVIGNFTSWGDGAVTTSLDTTDTTGKTYTATIKDIVAGSQEFGVTDDKSWTHKVYDAANDSNLKFTLVAGNDLIVTVEGDLSHFGNTTEDPKVNVQGTVTSVAWAA